MSLSFAFNPMTGQFDLIDKGSGAASGEDFHAGFNLIVSGSTTTVVENKNMVSYGLDIEGQLNVEGYLVLEM